MRGLHETKTRLEDRLLDAGDAAAVEALSAYLAALAQTTNPRTVLQWMNKTGSYETLLELLDGTLDLTHEALDTVQRGQSTIYLRAALVRHDVLPKRHQQSVSLAAYIDRELLRLPDGPDRVRLRTFAIWKVQHDLARAERQGRIKRTSEYFARTKIRVSTDLLLWLSEQHMTLPDLRQEHHGLLAHQRI
jgi:tRNA nucleotidyltransferase/poly(A) polymerase